MFALYLIATLVYASVGLHLYHALVRHKPIHKVHVLCALAVAIFLHTIVLVPQIMAVYGLNLNLFNTLSLTGLFCALFFVLFSLYRPILSLGVLAVPTAIAGLALGQFGHAPYHPLSNISPLLQAHILLSFAAYCVLLMASVQAVILRLQIRELKHMTQERFWVSKLPNLQSMENLLFDMILAGFVLLSVALCLGFMATYDILGQHIAHKMVFSLLSWLVFGSLIYGHWRHGWQVKRAANFTLAGFVLLAIGFVGSKAVLELILHR